MDRISLEYFWQVSTSESILRLKNKCHRGACGSYYNFIFYTHSLYRYIHIYISYTFINIILKNYQTSWKDDYKSKNDKSEIRRWWKRYLLDQLTCKKFSAYSFLGKTFSLPTCIFIFTFKILPEPEGSHTVILQEWTFRFDILSFKFSLWFMIYYEI